MELPPLLTYAGSWVAITGGIWVLFQRAETVLKPEVKGAISQWLQNLNPKTAFANWPSAFAAVFDQIFGERHLSWRCFLGSCVASFVAVIIVTLIWAALRPNQFIGFFQSETYSPLRVIAFAAVLLNLMPDYLSLLETRYIIRWMSRRASTFRILGLLTFDLFVTAVIFFLCLVFVSETITAVFIEKSHLEGALESLRPHRSLLQQILRLGQDVMELLRFSVRSPVDLNPSIFFYSTFFTSVWVWLYALSGLVVKLGEYLGISVRGLKAVLDIENKPLRSMGFVAMLLVTIVYLFAAPFVL